MKERKKKSIKVYYETWKQLKKEAVARDISIATLIEEIYENKV